MWSQMRPVAGQSSTILFPTALNHGFMPALVTGSNLHNDGFSNSTMNYVES
jgi:hypothetical protein